MYFLGCTVPRGKPGETYGGIEIHYVDGAADVVPLMYGFTLDGRYKTLTPAATLYLHASADPYQPYLALEPREAEIARIRLVAKPGPGPVPRITAVTCETDDRSQNLLPLPDSAPMEAEVEWLEEHTISAESLDVNQVLERIQEAYDLPPADRTSVRFRNSPLAEVGDGGRLDIVTSNKNEVFPFRQIPHTRSSTTAP